MPAHVPPARHGVSGQSAVVRQPEVPATPPSTHQQGVPCPLRLPQAQIPRTDGTARGAHEKPTGHQPESEQSEAQR